MTSKIPNHIHNKNIICPRFTELTPAQKNIADLHAFYSGSSISTLCGAVIFERLLDRELLVSALKLLVRRHEALRLRFCVTDGNIMQFVSDDGGDIGFEAFDSADEMRGYCRGQARTRFELGGEGMYRLTVFELPEQTGIMLCCSHLIADAWSYSILARDVYDIYERLQRGEAVEAEVRSYVCSAEKYAAYVQSEKHTTDVNFWEGKYTDGIGETSVRACRKSETGISAGRYVTSLPRELYSQAESFCRRNGISLAALFEGAVLLYLARINSAKTVTIGVPVLGRTTAAEKKTAGMYVTTLPLTAEVKGGESALALCKKVYSAHREIYRRRRLPYSEIKAAAGVSGRLFDVLVSFQNSRTDVPARTEWFSNGCSELPLALHIDDRDSKESCTLTLDYQTDIFPDPREAELLAGRIKHIVAQIVSGDISVGEISLLPDSERELLVSAFNSTDFTYRNDVCVHRAFSEIAAKYPDKIAVTFYDDKYTYKQLDEMSDTLAAFLAENGIGAGDVVPVIARRSPYIIIAMLAALKVGAAYMPVSPDYPAERVRYMTESVGAKTALTCGCEYKNATALESFDYRRTAELTPPECRPDDLCYVIFTSGSTGKPKATAVTHRNVINYCARNRLNICGGAIDSEKTIVSVTDFVFDIFVTESILALLNGITIILADDEQAVSQRQLGRLVRETGAEVLQTTPTKMRGFMLDKKDLGYLMNFSRIILGGEELPPDLVRELREHTKARIYNVYGPAETTVWSALTEADEDDITVGRPIANTKIYILDDQRRLLPVGVVGEICISGDGVSRGYLTERELTAQRFFPDPFGGGRMYRTGDMGLIRADGSVEFFGRRDSQIKLRGLRIELGEIECAMCGFGGVGLAAVSCKNERLTGFYTSEREIDERSLRQYLHRKLPAYMVPNSLVRLDRMPMTQSGKLDRKALPDAGANTSRQKYTAPANEAERQLCAVMAEILKLPQVGAEDDFFELGGDSFGAMELAAAAEDKGLRFSVGSVYEHRTVRRICAAAHKEPSLAETENRLKEKYRRYPQRRTAGDLMFFDAFVKLTKALYGFKVSGLENLDPGERYIICPNHESDLDCMWVWAALSGKFHLCEGCALIAEEHLDDPLKRFIFRVSGGIPIDRSGDFAPAMNRAAAVLKHRRLLLIHPEGTRTRSGRLGVLKPGAAVISKKTGIKIVPVKLTGAGRIYPVSRRYPHILDTARLSRYQLGIAFGKPIEPEGKSAGEIMDEVGRWLG